MLKFGIFLNYLRQFVVKSNDYKRTKALDQPVFFDCTPMFFGNIGYYRRNQSIQGLNI